ncbi:GMC oxidoreductase [Bernardetia sp. MNP-M8]|uniref:GMC oxidoreductase n=1 Tax=Bernardetia sp. MNP-M8 TaxID=3127470 RepID=UPI0030CC93E6
MKNRRLSKPIEKMLPHYDVVVIGSGYGGSITASRLSRAGKKVCLLERGKEYLTGEFPDTQTEAASAMQFNLNNKRIGSQSALYDFWIDDDINVFKGCGLGGTSLVNANVSIRPEKWVLKEKVFPKILQDESENPQSDLEEGYRLAYQMLKPNPYPDTFPKLDKLEAHRKSAKAMNQPFYKTDINVNFDIDGENHVGVEQKPCNLCGDCVSGCNVGAKNTTMMNYLPDAVNFGADIFVECSVSHLEKNGEQWIVHFELLGAQRTKFDAPEMYVTADTVVLSAGTLGSTEIMLRSRDKGLEVSNKLGFHFSGNGDVLGFGYNTNEKINGIGRGQHLDKDNPVGPCITSVIDLRKTENKEEGMILEEGSAPSPMAKIFPEFMITMASLAGKDENKEGFVSEVIEKKRELESVVRGAYKGATQNTQTYLIMTHDKSAGVLTLKDNRLQISWSGVGNEEIFKKASDHIGEATKALNGTSVPNPTWTKLFNKDLVTVHPLGGCIMGEDTREGVVNHKGQVFCTKAEEDAVYENLYIADGSIVPRSLGANPLLTISALSERICKIMAREKGWEINYDLPSKAPILKELEEMPIGIQFTETMKGFINEKTAEEPKCKSEEEFEREYNFGKSKNQEFKITLTVICEDLEKMLHNKEHLSRMVGTVEAPSLSADPLLISEGSFQLFVEYEGEMETKRMVYKAKLFNPSGESYNFEGYKTIRGDKGFDMWSDTTTLYTTIYADIESVKEELLDKDKDYIKSQGIIHVHLTDFIKQMTTMKALHADTNTEKLKALYSFGKYFAGNLYDTYGGVFARDSPFNPSAPPRKKRPLRAPEPQIYPVTTSDGVALRLTRYDGRNKEVLEMGVNKGSVMLAHGFSVSGLIFEIDTPDTNLVEYLCAHGYDVWVMEYRTSIALPSAKDQATADDIALKDFPACVDKVLEVTGEKDIQLFTHCVGAVTGVMAMLAGLKGVRSMVCFQVATDIIGGEQIKLKAAAHVPTLLKKFGVKTMTAYTDSNSGWLDKALNTAVKAYSSVLGSDTNDPIANRVTFMFSTLYEKENIDEKTFDSFHEMFGVTNLTTYEQLTLMSREKELRNAEGEDVYLPHAKDRLNIPMCFVHGEKNEVFVPEATERTYNRLKALNPEQHYERHVIEGYGHQDCVIGKNADRDVWHFVVEFLDKNN